MKSNQTNETWGLTQEEMDGAKEIVPTFNLSNLEVGKSAHFKITSAAPKMIDVKIDKNDPNSEKRKVPTVIAIDKLTGMKVTLWLSAKSLRMEFYKLYRNNNNSLKDLDVVVTPRSYEHEQWGETRGYTAQVDQLAQDMD